MRGGDGKEEENNGKNGNPPKQRPTARLMLVPQASVLSTLQMSIPKERKRFESVLYESPGQ